jgi:hypothetical protein
MNPVQEPGLISLILHANRLFANKGLGAERTKTAHPRRAAEEPVPPFETARRGGGE